MLLLHLVGRVVRSFVLFIVQEVVTDQLPHGRHTRARPGEEGSTGHGEKEKPKGKLPILECSSRPGD